MNNDKIALVTGGNRGLGFETCRQLGRIGFHVILAARDTAAGEQAAQTLRDEGLEVEFQQLDVTDSRAVRRVADYIGESWGRLDALVNNAGIFPDSQAESGTGLETPPEPVLKAFAVNTLGPLRLTQALAPLMRRGGRIVNVSSGMGALGEMGGGWPAYRISKTALNAVTRIFASELKDTPIKVNSVCPGWVRTDMGGPNAPRLPEQGVETIVWAATLPADGPTGGFFRDKEPIEW